jgi:hypothetical protein
MEHPRPRAGDEQAEAAGDGGPRDFHHGHR